MNQDAEWLLREKYWGLKNREFEADLERLAEGEPLGYIIGHIPFLNCTIHLDSKPLIPRPETEFWVEKAITDIQNDGRRTSIIKVLDLCAGSGAIGVAVAKHIPDTHITFAEIDKFHLPTIKRNIDQNLSVNRKVLDGGSRVVASDLFEKLSDRYDFILSNPPYIDPALDRAEPSVKGHEPHLALYGGLAGMELIERIIKDAPAHLTDHGVLYIEHEPEQSAAINELAGANNFISITYEDQYGVERYSRLAL